METKEISENKKLFYGNWLKLVIFSFNHSFLPSLFHVSSKVKQGERKKRETKKRHWLFGNPVDILSFQGLYLTRKKKEKP